MTFSIDITKLAPILKGCFLFYSYKIGNFILDIRGEKTYKFDYTENTSLYNFANSLKEKNPQYLNIEWLFDYFNAQFTYWSFIKEQKEKNGTFYQIKLHWVLGKKALNRYLTRTQKDIYFYHSKFYPTYDIKKEDLIEFLRVKGFIKEEEDVIIEEDKIIKINPLQDKEEKIKNRYFNKIEGFYLCINYTTLFKYNSSFCKECNYKNKCKKLLKKTYPKIYQKRLANKIMLDRKNLENLSDEERERQNRIRRENIKRIKAKSKINRR